MALKVSTNNPNSSTRKKRPGVHSKTKTSNSKTSKFYKKTYKGQGK